MSEESKLSKLRLLLTSKDVAFQAKPAADTIKKDEPLSGESNEKAIQTDNLEAAAAAIKRTPSDQGELPGLEVKMVKMEKKCNTDDGHFSGGQQTLYSL